MAYQLKKIFSENPFLDHVVYQAKYIALNCVTKDEAKANSYETVETMKAFDVYKACYMGHPSWNMFDSFPFEVLKTACKGRYTDRHIQRIFSTKSNIPIELRQDILDVMGPYFLEHYEEKNDYYRELNGLRPSYSTERIELADFGFENNLSLQDGIEYTYLDELPDDMLKGLIANGILEKIITAYPNEKWIKNIRLRVDKSESSDTISIYATRMAEAFDLLYIPGDVDEIIRQQFAERYEVNQEYILGNVYSEAMKVDSDYYDNFIQILIIITTMVDMMDTVQDHIVRRDIFDARCIQFIFEQYGVPYYDEIPLRYQINMIKNLNMLLKFKSTARCMIDLCSMFGFDSSQIFQYYLLRKRKLNENGDFQFNYKTVRKPNEIGVVSSTSTSFNIQGNEDYVRLEYPTEDYFVNGNQIEVWLDNELLPPEYYTIYEDKLYFEDKSILESHSKIEIKYLYNEDKQAIEDVGDHSILQEDELLEYSSNKKVYQLHPPIENYFELGGFVYVILGTLLLHEDCYDLDTENNQIIIREKALSHYNFDKQMRILYIYSSAIKINRKLVDVEAIMDKQTTFIIPEPFKDYYDTGSRFFLSCGGAYIHESRYHVKGNTLIFNDSTDGIKLGKLLTFHFLYNDFNNVEIVNKKVEVKSTSHNQTRFDIPVPYESYFDDGNTVFIKVKGFYMPPEYYDIVKNELIIDSNYGVYENGIVEFEFVYGKVREVRHSAIMVKATLDYQTDFHIPFPYEGFLERGNKLRVRYNGVEYREGVDYVIKEDILEIFSVDKSIPKGDELEFHFYSHLNNADHVTVSESQAKMITTNQTRFIIPVPFYRYFSTGNKMIMTIGGIFVSPDQYEMNDNRLHFTDPSLIGLVKDRELNFTFIYHTAYSKYDQAVHLDTNTHDLTEQYTNPDGSLKVKIPFPFENYLELGNEFSVRVNGTVPVNEGNYDIIDNEYILIFEPDKYVYPYGKNIQFVFVYTCTGYVDEIVEDIEKDVELKFVKIPILNNPDKYIKDERNYLDYDTVTTADASWDGDFVHEEVKKAILERDFSYNRTKYFSITSITSMAQVAYQLPYFMNMMLDRVKHEERLTLKLPYLSSTHDFRFNDVLTYMMALSHRYIGVVDDIPNIQRSLYIKGFNFEADLAMISAYIQEKLANYGSMDNMQVSDKYKEFKMYKGQVPTYKELIEIYTTNTEIYDHVVDEMLNAENKVIYDIYKKIYDSIMITKESKEYFKINNTIAPTITDWLKYRDDLLYNSLLFIDSITDEKDKRKLISQYIEDCNYQISEYIDSDTFRFVLGSFNGVNSDALLKYLTMVINFFKSYKIQIYNVATQYVFDDKLENTIRPIDMVFYNSSYNLTDDGHTIFDTIYYFVSCIKKDRITADSIREQIKIAISKYRQLEYSDRPDILDYINNFIVKMILDDEVEIEDPISFISQIYMHDEFDDIISDLLDNITTEITPKDRSEIIEKYYAIVSKYKQMNPIEEKQVKDDINEFISSFDFLERYIDDNTRDWIGVKTYMTLYESLTPKDGISYNTFLTYEDLVSLKDKIELIRSRAIQINKIDRYNDFYDKLIEYCVTYRPIAIASPKDVLKKLHVAMSFREDIKINIKKDILVTSFVKIMIDILDRASLLVTLAVRLDLNIEEKINMLVSMSYEDGRDIKDKLISLSSTLYGKDRYDIKDNYLRTQFNLRMLNIDEYVNVRDNAIVKTF